MDNNPHNSDLEGTPATSSTRTNSRSKSAIKSRTSSKTTTAESSAAIGKDKSHKASSSKAAPTLTGRQTKKTSRQKAATVDESDNAGEGSSSKGINSSSTKKEAPAKA
jgi:hypothetical protein